MQKFTFLPKTDPPTLLGFLVAKLSLSSNKAKRLLDKRLVFINKRRVWIASYVLNKGDVVEVVTEEPLPQKSRKVTPLFQDSHYLIVSKLPYLLTNGAESLETYLRRNFKDPHIQAVHRLDKNTSGAVIFAMNKEPFERMKPLFKEHLIKKTYRTIVRGCIDKRSFTISTPIQGQQAVTRVTPLSRGKEASYLEVEIETGRTHQIMIHLASIGHPVIGETEYDRKPVTHPSLQHVQRQMLHAYQISFEHPYTHEPISVTADVPDDFNQSLNTLCLMHEQKEGGHCPPSFQPLRH
ncbi:MAG: RluA family pseudouridine synthase [Planctomycetota bacterium]